MEKIDFKNMSIFEFSSFAVTVIGLSFTTLMMLLNILVPDTAYFQILISVFLFTGWLGIIFTVINLVRLKFEFGLTQLFFVLFLIWSVLAFVVNSDASRDASVAGLMQYFAFAGFFGCAYNIKDYKLKKLTIGIFLINITLLSFSSLLNVIGIYPSFLTSNENFASTLNNITFKYGLGYLCKGVFEHFNYFGYYLCIAVPVCAGFTMTVKSRIAKILCAVSAVLTMLVFMFNDTFGSELGMIGAFISLLVMYNVCGKKHNIKPTVIFIIIMAAFMALIPIDENGRTSLKINGTDALRSVEVNTQKLEEGDPLGKTRKLFWTTGLEYISEKPIFGNGLDSVRDYYSKLEKMQDTCMSMHNEYLHIAFGSGIPALLFYIAAIASAFIKGIKNRKKLDGINILAFAAVFAYLISAFFGNRIYNNFVYFIIMLGFAVNINSERTEQ